MRLPKTEVTLPRPLALRRPVKEVDKDSDLGILDDNRELGACSSRLTQAPSFGGKDAGCGVGRMGVENTKGGRVSAWLMSGMGKGIAAVPAM